LRFQAFEFSWEDIDKMYNTFSKFDRDKSGALDKTELLNILREEVPDSKEEDAQWFLGMVDTDNSNTVSFGEYVKGIAEFGKKGRRAMTRFDNVMRTDANSIVAGTNVLSSGKKQASCTISSNNFPVTNTAC
jgi:hypothetical protein